MHDRSFTEVYPVTRKFELWPKADLHAQSVAIEILRFINVTGEHEKVLHHPQTHSGVPPKRK
jgi:hypothetical protein